MKIQGDLSPDAAVRRLVGTCLTPVRRHVGHLGSGVGTAVDVHQARVGIRRLRTVLREFGRFGHDVDPSWAARLAEHFRRLGVARDSTVLAELWADALRRPGCPAIEVPLVVGGPVEVTVDDDLVEVLRELGRYARGKAAESDRTFAEVVPDRLDRLHRRIIDDSEQFADFSDEQRHTTRKRVKRLRYAVELTAPLYPRRDVRRFLAALEPAQEALGRFNDFAVAAQHARRFVDEDPALWYLVGWFDAHAADSAARAVGPLRRAAAARQCWG